MIGPTTQSVTCGGCGYGERTIWECRRHGFVLPFHEPQGAIGSCQTCRDYERRIIDTTRE